MSRPAGCSGTRVHGGVHHRGQERRVGRGHRGGPPGPCGPRQLFGNPGFESDRTAWTAGTGVFDNYSAFPAVERALAA
ncbi:hypothetical protein [Streptomyces lateritius]|uniref:hypothetical protein n=1 Tax=Streptomyces lateritius TaxID=67313 RepID=UPI001C8C992B|nr:hypothetical protein [Streptomyces lateritius]MBX9422093.1 hypothetical protein [Streptomyces lateritius]